MQDYMKSLLKSSIETVVNKYHRNQTVNENQESCAFSMKEIAIKVSIEFCLAISDVGFLFNEIYNFFEEKGMSEQFVINLCSPILAGSFVNECVPEDLLLRLIRLKEEDREYNTMEHIILNINMTPYNGKVNQQG